MVEDLPGNAGGYTASRFNFWSWKIPPAMAQVSLGASATESHSPGPTSHSYRHLHTSSLCTATRAATPTGSPHTGTREESLLTAARESPRAALQVQHSHKTKRSNNLKRQPVPSRDQAHSLPKAWTASKLGLMRHSLRSPCISLRHSRIPHGESIRNQPEEIEGISTLAR